MYDRMGFWRRAFLSKVSLSRTDDALFNKGKRSKTSSMVVDIVQTPAGSYASSAINQARTIAISLAVLPKSPRGLPSLSAAECDVRNAKILQVH